MKYRPDIDGLRAVAVLLVLVFHFSLIPAVNAGFLGVDIFFVISGFLITTILTKQFAKGEFRLSGFYVNRIRRLAPALFVVLILSLFAGWLLLFPDDLVDLARQILWSQLYIANIFYWRNINYFGLQAHDVFFLHTWSLAVEEQFYLLFPGFLLLVFRFAKRFFWGAVALIGLISFGLNIVFVSWKPEAAFYLLPTRAWEMLLGAVMSWVVGNVHRSQRIDEVLGWAGIALIVISATFYRADFRIPGFYALLPTMGAVFLLVSGQSGLTTISKVLSLPAIVYLGRISYSLYLVHWPIHVFASRVLQDYTIAWRVVMFIASGLLASLIYHVIENPIRRSRNMMAGKRVVVGYSTGIVATISLFALVSLTNGLPARFPSDVIRLADSVNDRTEPLEQCSFKYGPLTNNSFCPIGSKSKSPIWVVYGDSHAWAAHAAFDKWLETRNESGLFIFRHSCAPLIGVHLFGDRACFLFNSAIEKFIESRPDLLNIALVSIWRQGIEGALSLSEEITPSPEQSLELFNDSLSRTLKRFHDLGRKVYVWEPVPGARGNVPRMLAEAALQHRPADIKFSLAQYQQDYRFFFEALDRNRELVSGLFSPSEALCSQGTCEVSIDGVPLYVDGNHISKSTADVWVKVLQRGMLDARDSMEK